MTGKRRKGKADDAAPPASPAASSQLPLYAKMPKHHSNHPGLFIQSPERTSIKQLGATMLAKDGTINSAGFTTRLELPLPKPMINGENGQTYTITDAALIAQGAHRLGANELRVYQGILGLALQEALRSGPRAELTPADVQTPRAIQLRAKMGYAESRPVSPILAKHYPEIFRPLAAPCVVTLKTSLDSVVNACGMTRSKSARTAVVAAIRALSSVTMMAQFRVVDGNGRVVVVEESGIEMKIIQHRFVFGDSESRLDGDVDGRLRNRVEIYFDPHVTEVLAASPQARYSLVPLEDMRELKGDVALLLHNRLCGIIDRGKSLRIGMNKLISYVYMNPSMDREVSSAQVRKWRMYIREALEELRAIGWGITQLRAPGANTEEVWLIERTASKSLNSEPTFAQLALLASKMQDVELDLDAPSLDPGEPPKGGT